MLRAQDYDAATLKRLLPGIEFETAIETIEIISEKTQDKQMYDQREKAQRDYEWALSGAREEGERLGLEKGERLGLEKGERLGLEKGERLGLEKGERLGLEKGELAGKIQLLEELLGVGQSNTEELRACNTDTLAVRLAELQQKLRDRQA